MLYDPTSPRALFKLIFLLAADAVSLQRYDVVCLLPTAAHILLLTHQNARNPISPHTLAYRKKQNARFLLSPAAWRSGERE